LSFGYRYPLCTKKRKKFELENRDLYKWHAARMSNGGK
jgi:hypothetical protein